MSETVFQMRKARSYGQIINGVFVFVRAYKDILYEALWKVLLPLITIATLCVALFANNLFVIWENNETTPETGDIVIVVLSGLLVFVVFLFASLASYLIQYSLFGLAVTKNNDFTFQDVYAIAKKKFWGFFGLVIVSFMASGILSNIVSLPVAWIPIIGMFFSMIISSFFTSIVYIAPVPMFVENQGFSKSIDRAIACIKGYAWKNAGLYGTLTIIHFVLTISLLLPISITLLLFYLYVPGFFEGGIKQYQTLFMIVGCANIVVLSFGMFFFSIVPIVGMGLQYLNIVERREAVSLSLRVNKLLEMYPPKPVEPSPVINSDMMQIGIQEDESPLLNISEANITEQESVSSESDNNSNLNIQEDSTDSNNSEGTL
ncbi:MAG: hypothetical protein JNJ85_08340 [Candidatus Kapabacteria bacterium]|nr:hypothetical protein [Candidatus Kapabacteria bacterium]